MDTLVVWIIVAAAAVYMGRRLFKLVAGTRRHKDGGCSAGCGCSPEK
jgi:hypothetical protein